MYKLLNAFSFGNLLVILAAFVLPACRPQACGDQELVPMLLEGQINSCDVRNCGWCGGWYLETTDTIYNFHHLPAGSDIDLHSNNFPIYVRFNYVLDTANFHDQAVRIILTEIELQ